MFLVFSTEEKPVFISVAFDRSDDSWIGLTYDAQKGDYVWLDGVPLDFSMSYMWAPSEPGGTNGCVGLNMYTWTMTTALSCDERLSGRLCSSLGEIFFWTGISPCMRECRTCEASNCATYMPCNTG